MKILKTFTIAASIVLTTVSFAGTVKLESPQWDNICKVQVTTGKNSLPNKIVNTYTNVKKGFSVSGTDRLCYRRSTKPTECNSRYTEWKCNTSNGSGTSILRLI